MRIKNVRLKKKKKEQRLLDIIIENPIVRDYFMMASKMFAILGIVFLIIAYSPSVFYNILKFFGLNRSEEVIAESVVNINPRSVAKFENYVYQPEFDSKLPEDNILTIKSVGIKTVINEALDIDSEEALRKGVWRVSSFGTPYLREYPTILVAHRYGYLRWSVAYRLKNSFYNLPKVKVDDEVEINWLQRRYRYKIYKKEEGLEITDYSANLILYTCRDLTSDIKVFVYARLLEE